MKKFLFVTIALIAFSCYSAHASPVPAVKYEQTIAKDVGYAPAVIHDTYMAFERTEISDVYFPVNDVAAADALVVKTEFPRSAADPTGPPARHYIYRHYFSHEDNKRYAEFKQKEPCKGFIQKKEVPIR